MKIVFPFVFLMRKNEKTHESNAGTGTERFVYHGMLAHGIVITF
jgi:hypothetical protein